MPFRNVQFITSLPSVALPKQEEENEDYRPVMRQSTVGSETTKDKSGALPPVVYTKQSSVQANVLRIPYKSSNNSDDKIQQVSKPSSERLETPDNNSETTDASINFISDDAIQQVTLASRLGTSNVAESDFHHIRLTSTKVILVVVTWITIGYE